MSAYSLARAGLFRIGGGDAEAAHEWTLRRLSALPPWVRGLLRRRYFVPAPVRVFGVDFPNPVGLAAGVDKNGVALPAWPALGFGFVEVGTVTAVPQPGNPRPRLFRLPGDLAVINRMGFNNEGAAALAARLSALGRPPVPLGISLGKSKVTPLPEAVADYRASYDLLRDHAAYVAVNVSSPNTPGLRALQDRSHLDAILSALVPPPTPPPPASPPPPAATPPLAAPVIEASPKSLGVLGGRPDHGAPAGGPPAGGPPVLVKIAPDLTEQAIAEVLEVCLERGAAGVIATNTTLSRPGASGPHGASSLHSASGPHGASGLHGASGPHGASGQYGASGSYRDAAGGLSGPHRDEAGGLSGRPLTARAREVVSFVHRETGGALPIVGVGGIVDPDDATSLFDAGAALVQLYTGFIYRGPALVRASVRAARDRGVPAVVRASR